MFGQSRILLFFSTCVVSIVCCACFFDLSQHCNDIVSQMGEKESPFALSVQGRCRLSVSPPRRLREVCLSVLAGHGPTRIQTLPRLKPESQDTRTQVEAATHHCASSPVAAYSSCRDIIYRSMSCTSWCGLVCCILSWDLRQEEGQWQVYAQHVSLAGTQKLCQVPDVEVRGVDELVQKHGFFFQPHVQLATASRFSQPSGSDMSRAFS